MAALVMAATIALVLLPNFVWLAITDRLYLAHSVPYILMTAVFPSLIAVLGLFAIFGRWPWLPALVVLPFLVVVPIETAYIVRYGEPTFYAIVATIFESNSRETIDFLGVLIWPLAIATIACFAFGVFAVVYLYRSGYAWRHRSRVWILTACVTAALTPLILVSMQPQSVPAPSAASATPSAGNARQLLMPLPFWLMRLEPSFPVGVVVRLARYRADWEAMRKSAARLQEFQFHSRQLIDVAQRQVYVLVIGETGRRDRWQLYGYERATNPELSAVPELVKFDDLISPWAASRLSVPTIVTRKRATDTSASFDERSVMHAFAEAGFQTYWLSNQLAVGEFDSPIAIVAHDADHVSFYNVADWGKPGNYDEVLLAPLKAALASDARKLFIVLHTLGSHMNYAYRYPPAFDRFTPSLKDVPNADYYSMANAQRIYNSYDNSILYTDHLIAEVIRVLRAEKDTVSTMWYTADHGEDLISESCKFAGHGNGTASDYPVPSVFWYSDAYAQSFGPQLAQLREHAAVKATTENFFESLIDMAALDFPGHDPSWSLFSAHWQPHTRLVHALFDVDFDTADRSQKCNLLWPHEK